MLKTNYGLIFDVDGVIADSERVNAQATIKVFAELFDTQGVQRQDFEAGLGRGAEAYVKSAAVIHGLALTDEQVYAASKARQTNFLNLLGQETLPPFPGVVELMDAALAHHDFRVAIATSSARDKSEAVLTSAQIPYKTMVYITGNDVKSKKPDPELFLRAAQGIDVPPEQCVVIEDAPNGIKAAKAAGCQCIAVTNSTTADKLSQADRIATSLTEISINDLMALLP
ncbi:MAG: HAD family phosphatase [Planctomycetes bacterium]|nr:HAD family phosphatase [Planctomycetota bacterium]